MPSMEVVEFFQDEVQFPYGVIERVSANLTGTLFPFSEPNRSNLNLFLLIHRLHCYIMAMSTRGLIIHAKAFFSYFC